MISFTRIYLDLECCYWMSYGFNSDRRMFPATTITTSWAPPRRNAYSGYTSALNQKKMSPFFLSLSLRWVVVGVVEDDIDRCSSSIYLAAIAQKLDGKIDVAETASQVEAEIV